MILKAKEERFSYKNFAVALLAVLAVVIVTLLIPALGNGGMYFLFLTAIIFSALYGNVASGAFAAVLSIVFNFLLLDYQGKTPQTLGDWLVLLAFGLAAGFTVFICHARINAENARRLAESRYRAIFEDAITGIYETTFEGRYAAANPKLAQMFGYDSPAHLIEEAENLNKKFYVEAGRREEFARLVEEKGNVAGFESEIYRRDNARIWISENALAVRDEGGKLVGYQGTTIEITDRKRAEAELETAHAELETAHAELEQKVAGRTAELQRANQILRDEISERERIAIALRESELRLRSVVTAAPIVLFALDHEGKFTLSEGNALDLLKLQTDELIGQSIFDIYHEVPAVSTDIQRVLQGEAFTNMVVIRDLVFETHYSPVFNDDGKVAGVIGVSIDVTRRKRIEGELLASQKQLRDLAAHLLSVREEEGKRIARELHDELGQMLTALKIDLVRLQEKAGSEQQRRLQTSAQITNQISQMLAIVDGAMETTRKIVAELRPGVLDELGLEAAFEWQVQEFQKRTGIECRMEIDFDEDCACQNAKTTLFRILQECLTNIARHSGARRARILLRQEVSRLLLEIEDDGRGISDAEAAHPRSFGILGMRERALLLGGAVEINRLETGGTGVAVTIPRPKPSE